MKHKIQEDRNRTTNIDYKNLKVHLLGITLKCPLYLKIQCGVVTLLLLAGLAFRQAADSDNVIVANLWWICLAWIPLEVLEVVIAITLAKRKLLKQT
tara:strand:+ start:222 stop:512 length:291 start_codon:yes stop_codon:yes gene_type:complete